MLTLAAAVLVVVVAAGSAAAVEADDRRVIGTAPALACYVAAVVLHSLE